VGPNLQMPSLNQVFDFQFDEAGKLVSLTLRQDWAAYFQSLQQVAIGSSRNGPTTERPTDSFKGRYIGMPFFDTTLGFPVFLEHASSNAWVDATGAPA
jgi:hypothetical protein